MAATVAMLSLGGGQCSLEQCPVIKKTHNNMCSFPGATQSFRFLLTGRPHYCAYSLTNLSFGDKVCGHQKSDQINMKYQSHAHKKTLDFSLCCKKTFFISMEQSS